MAILIVRLGSPRQEGEGLRVGAVRRPPRGIPKSEWASRNFFDVWFPNLAPSEALLKRFRPIEDDRHWRQFERSYRSEMKRPENKRLLELFAALSRQTDFSVGCYCADEQRCHRSILCDLLTGQGAVLTF
jgi:uncharacterized protein YeaO (DUF488 family)